MGFTDTMRSHFDAQQLTPIDVSDLGMPEEYATIYVAPLTVHQAEQIDRETEGWRRIARHFQVRAKDAEGKHLVTNAQMDELFKCNARTIGLIVTRMQDVDMSAEDIEKKY